MDDVINLLRNVITTMDTISVTGIDNQDKFVGCANAILTATKHLEQLAEQQNETEKEKKEETPDG